MSTAKELAEQYAVLFHDGTTRDIGEMAQWWNQTREFLQSVEVTSEQAELIDLAFLLGRGGIELRNLLRGWARAVKIRHGRLAADLDWDAPMKQREEAAAKAHKLKAEGVQNFVAVIAREYGKDCKTINRWMKKYPPGTRA